MKGIWNISWRDKKIASRPSSPMSIEEEIESYFYRLKCTDKFPKWWSQNHFAKGSKTCIYKKTNLYVKEIWLKNSFRVYAWIWHQSSLCSASGVTCDHSVPFSASGVTCPLTSTWFVPELHYTGRCMALILFLTPRTPFRITDLP